MKENKWINNIVNYYYFKKKKKQGEIIQITVFDFFKKKTHLLALCRAFVYISSVLNTFKTSLKRKHVTIHLHAVHVLYTEWTKMAF